MTEQPGPDVAEQLAQVRAQRAALDSDNAKRLAAIAAMGAQPDIMAVAAMRLESFITFFFARIRDDAGVRELLQEQFEAHFQANMAEMLRGMEGSVRRAQLAAGPADLSQVMRGQNGHGRRPR